MSSEQTRDICLKTISSDFGTAVNRSFSVNIGLFARTLQRRTHHARDCSQHAKAVNLQSAKHQHRHMHLVQAGGEVFVHRPGKSVAMESVQHEPVWVSLAEAQAYCNWAGGRVMSEEEYERAAEHTRYNDRLVVNGVMNGNL